MMSSDNFYDLSAILSTMTKRNVTVDKKSLISETYVKFV
jgi:hypothetical protein